MSSPVRNIAALKGQTSRRAAEQSDGLALLPPVASHHDHAEGTASSQRANAPRLSVVVPAMNEAGNIPALHKAIADTLEATHTTFELILVDDGSTDGTWPAIEALSAQDRRVIGLRHRRNFGKARALATGFSVARGEFVLTMDADLQDDPTELPRFLVKLDEGYDLVSGWKQRRQDPLGKTAPSKLFNATVRRASGVQLHDFNCGFKAYRHEVTQQIRLYGELHRFTPVLADAEGFRIAELPVKHHPRTWGQSKYGYKRLVKGFLDLLTVVFLTHYRQRPMHLFGIPGLVALFLGIGIGIELTFERLFLDERIGTRPLLMLCVLLVVIGTQFFGLGLLGEFLAHGSNAPRPEPSHVIRESLGLPREVRADTADA